jgi:hypothetical protein
VNTPSNYAFSWVCSTWFHFLGEFCLIHLISSFIIQVSSQEQNSKIEEVQSPPLEQTKDMFFAQTQTSYRPKPPTTPPPAIFDDQFEDATIDFFQDDKQASVDTSNEVNQSATQEKPEKPWWQFWD